MATLDGGAATGITQESRFGVSYNGTSSYTFLNE
jgi:hypothetical protein